MPHGEKGGGREEGGRRDGMELPGRYIGGIFQIYYPLICYFGGREERRKEGELHYFFVVPSYVKFVGSFIHTGSSEWPLYSLTHDFFALVFVPTLVTTEGEMRDFQNSSSARRPLS